MSSVVARAGQLKPDIRLAAAISQFEADLTTEQKTELHRDQSRLTTAPPTTHDVMRFIAEINDRASRRGGRCLSTRLINVLKATQEFAALGDIIVGGSQNLLACGVWSLVRMTLFSLVAFTSYVDKLTEFLMIVGRSAPCYENMIILYPRSKNLQSYLVEYFIVIVDLCHKLLKLTKQSIIQQLTSFWNTSDLDSYKTKLDGWGQAIRMEVDLLTKKSIEDQGSRIKALTKFYKRDSFLQRQYAYHRVLDSCSQYDHRMTWKEMRKVGNTTLFQESPEYIHWKKRSDIRTLVCTGKLGSGKSVWLANIVDDLTIFIENPNCPVAYFFCRHDVSESLKARTVIGSLARQILAALPQADFIELERLVNRTSPVLDFDGLLSVLRRALPPDFKGYFVLDGLDECDSFERKQLTKQLQTLQDEFLLWTCISLRLEADNVTRLSQEEFGRHKAIAIPEENPDIEGFISVELEKCLEMGRLVIRDPGLILEIQDALLAGSQGMFLWVALQIENLCTVKTDEAIREALADLPKSLPETYARILQKSGEKGESCQARIFELITVAHRPLTVEELGDALSVVPGDTTWSPDRILNDVNAVLAHCGSLIYIDEEMLTVRLLHHSVKQFLLGEFSNSTGPVVSTNDANASVAAIILTYLNYNIFKTQVSTTVVPQIMAEEAPSRILRSIGSSSSTLNLAISLLRSRRQANFNIGPVLAEVGNRFALPAKDELRFYDYAKAYWQRHACSVLQDQQPEIFALLKRLVEQEVFETRVSNDNVRMLLLGAVEQDNFAIANLLIGMGVNLRAEDTIQGETPLLYAVGRGDGALVELLLKGEAPLETRDPIRDQTPLLRAADHGYEGIFKRLLEEGAVLEAADSIEQLTSLTLAAKNGHIGIVESIRHIANLEARDLYGRDPISWAAVSGHADIVKSLHEAGANLEGRSRSGTARNLTPLSLAASNGHNQVVELLVELGASLEIMDSHLQTPLFKAAEYGRTETTQLLIKLGANLEAKDTNDDTPLLWAVRNCQKECAWILLANGANIEVEDSYRRTPLAVVAEQGYEDVARMLIDKGAELESANIHDPTPLSRAADNGHEGIVRYLVEKGANMEAKDTRSGWTPLCQATWKGHTRVVKYLVEKGANVEVRDMRHGRTPVALAAGQGREDIVKFLVSKGVNCDNKDGLRGQTPLSLAAASGYTRIVEFLLDQGVDLETRDERESMTPLALAARAGNEDIVRLLIERGADVEPKDSGSGMTPLAWAAGRAHEGIVRMLLEKGVVFDMPCGEDGWTPLAWAARGKNTGIVDALLQKGANMEAKDKHGQTPLALAVQARRPEMVEFLLDSGADILIPDDSGQTPLSLARSGGHQALITIIESRLGGPSSIKEALEALDRVPTVEKLEG